MDHVFIYWDNSNIFHEAQRPAEELEQSGSDPSERRRTQDARGRPTLMDALRRTFRR